MLELMESSKKEITTINEGMLKNATTKITQFHKIAKNAILGISMVLADIADKPKEYLENSGFNTIAEYTEEVFGYKKAYTYKLIKISKFISIKSIDTKLKLTVSDLINDKIGVDYSFETISDADGFEYSPSQMLELIPLTDNQFIENIKELDSSLTCKELRAIVKDIVNPPIEVKGGSSEENSEENKDEDKQEEKIELTDKDRILQMLEICSGMEDTVIKEKIINVFQKSLKALEK